MSVKNSIRVDAASVSGVTKDGHPKVVLVTLDAKPDHQVIPVGVIVEGCLDMYPEVARQLAFSPRALRLIAAEVEYWANRAQVDE